MRQGTISHDVAENVKSLARMVVLLALTGLVCGGCKKEEPLPGERLLQEGKIDEAISACSRQQAEDPKIDNDFRFKRLVTCLYLEKLIASKREGWFFRVPSDYFCQGIAHGEETIDLKNDDADVHLRVGVIFMLAAEYLSKNPDPDVKPFQELRFLRGKGVKNKVDAEGWMLMWAQMHLSVAAGIQPWEGSLWLKPSDKIRLDAMKNLDTLKIGQSLYDKTATNR